MSDRDAIDDRVARNIRPAFAPSVEPRAAPARLEARRGLSPCPEIDCVRHRLSPAIIAAAEKRALALDVGADEVLIAAGELTEETYYRALAFSLGLQLIDPVRLPRTACPLDDETLVLTVRSDMLPLRSSGGARLVVMAPRGVAARALVMTVRANSDVRHRLRLATPSQLRRFVSAHCGRFIGERAMAALHTREPALSAAPRSRRPGPRTWLALGLAACGICAAPAATAATVQGVLTATFLGSTSLRLFAAARSSDGDKDSAPSVSDASLPRFTIVAALYDEVEALPGLAAAIKALDYPPEKLQLILALEADDEWTRLAADALQSKLPFEVVLAFPQGPRTKPKALNCTLPFVRGDLVVVYDAEDRPEPGQLRRAAETFLFDPDGRLACVQARLTIDNTKDSWLAALFTAEYAGLFDVLLPGLARANLPIPLGGSSNHFRTEVLREVGGWDPYNVTEDADLGTRLAREGYRSAMIASTSYEEAPAELAPWLKQRTRWFKGWMRPVKCTSCFC